MVTPKATVSQLVSSELFPEIVVLGFVKHSLLTVAEVEVTENAAEQPESQYPSETSSELPVN